jgi:hypothetical protein
MISEQLMTELENEKNRFYRELSVFNKLHDKYKSDKYYVAVAVTINGLNLAFASDDLKNNKEIVLTAVKNDGNALKFASEYLRADKEVVLAAVANDGFSIE